MRFENNNNNNKKNIVYIYSHARIYTKLTKQLSRRRRGCRRGRSLLSHRMQQKTIKN